MSRRKVSTARQTPEPQRWGEKIVLVTQAERLIRRKEALPQEV